MGVSTAPSRTIPQESSRTESGKTEPRKLRLLLVDDHFYIREGLKSLLSQEADMEVIGETTDGESACRMAARASGDPAALPDIIIMDMSLSPGGMHGTTATARIKAANPHVLVVALSMHEDTTYVRAVLEAGASGYVLKRSATRELVQAIRSVAAGGTYLDPSMAGKLTAEYVRRSSNSHYSGDTAGYDLTKREEEVLRRVAQGFTGKEIAVQLAISPKSVES
jgi:DNA-binding NarL/FixJ family response regulator